MPLPQERIFTLEDINALPEGQRAELIDGQMFMHASPSANHQRLSFRLSRLIADYIDSNKGKCEVFQAPFDVFLNGDDSECFIPDISIICNPDIVKDRGCFGAPDWIIEITSPSTAMRDYTQKLNKYMNAGVKEYWIVNPIKQIITVYNFRDVAFAPINYTFKDKIKVNIYEDLEIDFSEMRIE